MRQRVFPDSEKRTRFQRWKKYLSALAVFLFVLALTLVSLFAPLRGLLPAAKLPARQAGELRVHFLNVGEGDCSIVEFPDGALLVIDAGNGSFANGNKVLRYIKGLEYTSLSYLPTHADIDHYGGFAQLATYYGADAVYLPVIGDGGKEYRRFLSAIESQECRIETLTRYGVVENGSGAYIVCISPYSQGETDENDASAVLYLEYAGVRMLFCADITSVRERRLMRDYALMEGIFDAKGHRVRLERIDVMKTAHHGSDESSCAEWLELLSPREAIISCGAGNRYDHPSRGAVARIAKSGACISRTDELGDIVMGVTENGYTIKHAFTELT